MQVDNRVLDEMARLAGGAFSTLTGLRNEVEAQFRQQLERLLGQMDVVRREEFEAVQAMVVEARSAQEAMAERVAALEAELAKLRAGS